MTHQLTKTVFSAAMILLASPALAVPETYVFDPAHTSITWHANHFGFSNPSGKFVKSEGSLVLDEEKPEDSKINVTVHPGSLVTGIEKFDTHLKSKDFLNVEQFSTATFVSDKVEITGKDTAKVHGTLTLLGVSKPIVLDVKLNKIGEGPMDKIKTAGFSATTTIKRSEFGINYGVPGVSDDVKVDIEMEAKRK